MQPLRGEHWPTLGRNDVGTGNHSPLHLGLRGGARPDHIPRAFKRALRSHTKSRLQAGRDKRLKKWGLFPPDIFTRKNARTSTNTNTPNKHTKQTHQTYRHRHRHTHTLCICTHSTGGILSPPFHLPSNPRRKSDGEALSLDDVAGRYLIKKGIEAKDLDGQKQIESKVGEMPSLMLTEGPGSQFIK